MSRNLARALLLAAILFAATWTQSRAANEKSLDPLVVDPQHYHLDFENQYVQVTREHMGPHGTMPLHQHLPPGALIVFVTARNNRLTTTDGKSQVSVNKPGEIQWAGPATHRSENLSDAEFEAIRVQPKVPAIAPKPAPPEKMDAVVIDKQHYKVEFENQYVRVIRLKVAPHEKLIMHKHPDTFAVVVNLTAQHMRQYHEGGGKPTESTSKAGTARWAPPSPAAHADENLSDQPMEVVRVELKMARP